jgi:hypothetical protein
MRIVLKITKAFLFVTWLKFNSTNEWQSIIANGDHVYSSSILSSGFSLDTNPDFGSGELTGSFHFGLGASNSSNTSGVGAYTVNSYNDNQWHHVALVFDQSLKQIHFYDGAAVQVLIAPNQYGSLISSGTIVDYSGCSLVTDNITSWSDTTISGWSDQNFNSFIGSLAEIGIYSTALSSADISSIYNHQK